MIPKNVVFIPIWLRNQKWDKYHFSGTQLWQRRAKGREFIMPPRRTGFNEYMPQPFPPDHRQLDRQAGERGGIIGV